MQQDASYIVISKVEADGAMSSQFIRVIKAMHGQSYRLKGSALFFTEIHDLQLGNRFT